MSYSLRRSKYSLLAILIAFTLTLLQACNNLGDVAIEDTSSGQDLVKTWWQIMEEVTERPALVYAASANWACTPDEGDLCDRSLSATAHMTDGTEVVLTLPTAPETEADCFYLYPTADLTSIPANHDDLTSVQLPLQVIRTQALPFSSVCRVIAPLYRQVSIGAYASGGTDQELFFKRALADAAASFEYYWQNWNQGRPVVLIGHSQGAQMITYLLYRYFDGNTAVTFKDGSTHNPTEMRKQLAGAMPIGFNFYVPKGQDKGGSLGDVNLCSDTLHTGCVVHYRSFAAGARFFGEAGGSQIDTNLGREGFLHTAYDPDLHELACVNPAFGPAVTDQVLLDRSGRIIDNSAGFRLLEGSQTVLLEDVLSDDGGVLDYYPRLYAARCRSASIGDILEIALNDGLTGGDLRGDPMNLKGLYSPLGMHIYDFHHASRDLVQTAAMMIEGNTQ